MLKNGGEGRGCAAMVESRVEDSKLSSRVVAAEVWGIRSMADI